MKLTLKRPALVIIASAGYLLTTPASSAPTTATFMSVLTVCGAGSTITIDANLQGSMVSLYEREATKGRAVQAIVTEIAKLLPQGDNYARYLECVKDTMSRL